MTKTRPKPGLPSRSSGKARPAGPSHGCGILVRWTGRRFRAAVALVLACLVQSAKAPAAESFRIESLQWQASRQLVLTYQADPAHYYLLRARDGISHSGFPIGIRLGPVTSGLEAFATTALPFGQQFYRLQRVPIDQPLDTDQDGVDDLFELRRPRYFNALDAADYLPLSAGALHVSDRSKFDILARTSQLPGTLGVREIKFLLAGLDTEYPVLYFMNTFNHEFHDEFAISALGWNISLEEYNRQTYFNDLSRRNLAGSVVAYDQYVAADGSKGLYAMEFWPADPIKFDHVRLAYQMVREGMPFVAEHLAYHPTGDSQIQRYHLERSLFENALIPVITTDELLGSLTYYPLVLGETFGRLRAVDGTQTVSARDIVVLQTLPSDLSLVAGIITETPQTPLSHVNLKAQQNQTPNAYIREATLHPDIAPWLDQYVHLEFRPDGFTITAATTEEVDAFLESIRPAAGQTPPRDLSVTNIQSLQDVGASDAAALGAKAANLAELAKILPAGMVPSGFAVPIYFYDTFMEQSGLSQAAQTMMEDPEFQANPELRSTALAALRSRIRNEGELPSWMLDQLGTMHASLPEGTTPRCRSSSNNEDLPGFNGAGLYDSYTHHADEGHIAKSIRQVWASLWNYRAFEEREFYRIDHRQAAMGVLVHPNYENELANGVAITRNIYNPDWKGFYINVQVGEDLVTNPQPDSIPDELLVSTIGQNGTYEIQYLRHSSYQPNGATVLNVSQVLELIQAMDIIQDHFKFNVYDAGWDPEFAMELEFKITATGRLNIKQARPWIQ